MTLIELLILGVANLLISVIGGIIFYFFGAKDLALVLGVFLGLFCLNFVLFLVWVNLPKKRQG